MSLVFFVREASNSPSINLPKVSQPEDLLPVLSWLGDEAQEHFVVITLNGANGVIKSRVITVGLLNHSLVHPREVFAPALTDRAASVVLVHNHPSGTPEPSVQDLQITNQLRAAGDILGIKVLDHIIILPGGGHVSLRQLGHMD